MIKASTRLKASENYFTSHLSEEEQKDFLSKLEKASHCNSLEEACIILRELFDEYAERFDFTIYGQGFNDFADIAFRLPGFDDYTEQFEQLYDNIEELCQNIRTDVDDDFDAVNWDDILEIVKVKINSAQADIESFVRKEVNQSYRMSLKNYIWTFLGYIQVPDASKIADKISKIKYF